MNLVDVNHTKGVHHTTPDAHTHGGHVCEFDRSSRAVREQMKSAASRRFLRANLNQQTNERTHKNARMAGLSPGSGPDSWSANPPPYRKKVIHSRSGRGSLARIFLFALIYKSYSWLFFIDNRITHCRHCLELWFARLDGALNYSCHIFFRPQNAIIQISYVAETKQSRCTLGYVNACTGIEAYALLFGVLFLAIFSTFIHLSPSERGSSYCLCIITQHIYIYRPRIGNPFLLIYSFSVLRFHSSLAFRFHCNFHYWFFFLCIFFLLQNTLSMLHHWFSSS